MSFGYNRIFAALDGASTQRAVMERAIALAAEEHAELTFGHVIDSVPYEASGVDFELLCNEGKIRIETDLADLLEQFGPERRITLCRELTKLHEEVRRTTLGEAARHYAENPPKGEFVLVIEGAPPKAQEEYTLEDGLAMVAKLQEQGMSARDAVKEAAGVCNLSRKALYDRVMKEKNKN